MIKRVLEPNVQQIEQLVAHLSQSDKIRLFRKLARQTALERMKDIFKEIDERRKQFPASDKETQAELETVRRRIYGPRRY